MALRPKPETPWRIVGNFRFAAEHPGYELIEDHYELEILVPPDFPSRPPVVRELGWRIPRDGNFHVNEKSDTLCLGSPLALAIRLKQAPSLVGFAESCIVPYLYGVSYKFGHGEFPFGELAHDFDGQWNEYGAMLQLKTEHEILAAFQLLGMKKRLANKRPCPCGCRKRLGRCRTNDHIRPLRYEVGRRWFRNYLVEYAKIQEWLKAQNAISESEEKPAA